MDSQSHGTSHNTQDPEVIMTSPLLSLKHYIARVTGFYWWKEPVLGAEHKNLDKKLFSHQLKQEKITKKCINSVINYADGKMINFNHLIINPLFVNWINFLGCVISTMMHHSAGIRKPIFSLNSPSDPWWPDPSQTGLRQHPSLLQQGR